jgi:hypothetical protein
VVQKSPPDCVASLCVNLKIGKAVARVGPQQEGNKNKEEKKKRRKKKKKSSNVSLTAAPR